LETEEISPFCPFRFCYSAAHKSSHSGWAHQAKLFHRFPRLYYDGFVFFKKKFFLEQLKSKDLVAHGPMV